MNTVGIGSSSQDLHGATATNRWTGHRLLQPPLRRNDRRREGLFSVIYFLNEVVAKALRHISRRHIRRQFRNAIVSHKVLCDVEELFLVVPAVSRIVFSLLGEEHTVERDALPSIRLSVYL